MGIFGKNENKEEIEAFSKWKQQQELEKKIKLEQEKTKLQEEIKAEEEIESDEFLEDDEEQSLQSNSESSDDIINVIEKYKDENGVDNTISTLQSIILELTKMSIIETLTNQENEQPQLPEQPRKR